MGEPGNVQERDRVGIVEGSYWYRARGVSIWGKFVFSKNLGYKTNGVATWLGERGGSVVECRTPEREVRGSRPTAAVLCPWARHFTPRKYWLITQEAMASSRHDWKIVDWDVKPQHNQPTKSHVAELSSDPQAAQCHGSARQTSGTAPWWVCRRVLWVPDPRGQYSKTIRFIE